MSSPLYGTYTPSPKSFNAFGSNQYIDGPKDFLRSNSIIAKLAFLVLVIFIFAILLRLGIAFLTYYFSFSTNPVLVNGMVDAEQLLVVAQNPNTPGAVPILRSTDQTDGLVFTWSVWLWIKNPPLSNNPAAKPNQHKHVFSKGNDQPGADGIVTPNNAPGLYIGPNYRELVVVMNTFENMNERIVIDDIPIEKWMNVIIRCQQNTLDVFINGTLTRSHKLSGVPKQNYDPVYVGLNGGFAGYVSSLQYYAYGLGVNKIQGIVNSGPSLTMSKNDFINIKPEYLSFRWFFPRRTNPVDF